MTKQLLLCKRLFSEGSFYADRSDSISSGISISLFQDAVEMYVWTLIKEKNITIKDGASFTSNLENVQKTGIQLSQVAKLIELNKARVGFKHYGNLPDSTEVTKYQAYVEDFLRTSFQNHFSQNFDDLSLADLVSNIEVRERLKATESLAMTGEYSKATREAAIAKAMLFAQLTQFIPKVNSDLKHMDSIISQIPEARGSRTFQYLAEYLNLLRETTLASLLKVPLQEYTYLSRVLPTAHKMGNGNWETIPIGLHQYDEAMCKRILTCLVNIAIRLETII
jgi:hypothetical protein